MKSSETESEAVRLKSMSMDQMFAVLSPLPIVLLDASFCILHATSTYLTLNNLTFDDCVGVNIYEVVKSSRLVPGVESLQHAIHTAIVAKTVHTASNIEELDGSYWTLRATPIFNGDVLHYVGLELRDTTADHQEHLAINEQLDANETYRILVETVKDYAIFMLDTQGRIKTWNAGAALLKGYTREEIIGQHFSVFYSEEDIIREKPKRELEICLAEGKVEDESWRVRKDGTRFWANVVITCVYRGSTHIGFSKVTRDLTERKAAESRVISAYEESAKLKSAFLAHMSHEIRTPMHGMLSALTLLMDSTLTPEQRELGGFIEESGGVLLQVINDILDYSKLESGAFSISSEAISTPDIVTSVARGYKTCLRPEVTIGTTIEPNVPKSAEGDPIRYRQVVQNMLENAVKFTESGSIDVHIALQSEDTTSYTILTEVIDTGIGIAESFAGGLFTPFTQLDISATKRHRGTGLGLSICKSLTELMGGSIGFRPNPGGQGSVFWFTTKTKKIRKLEQLDSLTNKLNSTTLVLPLNVHEMVRDMAPSKRLLLAEDNPINQKVMLMMLKRIGFVKIDAAADGREAIELLKANPLLYDLILMDISMPVLSGLEATMEIRKMGLRLPIIAMTANALKDDVDEYFEKGMNDYVPKPVDRELLMKVFLKWL
jgi:osomolarity two-component system, sensor histidine kinase TcsA